MTAGAQTPVPARSDGLDDVDGGPDLPDIMPHRAIGKPEMPDSRRNQG
jgi:hypothetical protein